MNLDEIREALFQAMDEQKAADIAANEQQEKLGQQKIMYTNDARGTLYSGQPTWERAQLAADTASNLAKINDSYLSNKINVWKNITNTLDEINSYNKSAATLIAQVNKLNSSANSSSKSSTQELLEIYSGL